MTLLWLVLWMLDPPAIPDPDPAINPHSCPCAVGGKSCDCGLGCWCGRWGTIL